MKKHHDTTEFQTFWDVWRPHARHTDGRGLARETFAKHVRAGANPQDIIDGAKWFFRSMKERDREFVPLSSTWMNRGSFEDMAIQERDYQRRIEDRQQRTTDTHNVVRMPHKTRFQQEWESRGKTA